MVGSVTPPVMAAMLLSITRAGGMIERVCGRGAATGAVDAAGGLTSTSAPLGMAALPAGAVSTLPGTPAVGGAGGVAGGLTPTWASPGGSGLPFASTPGGGVTVTVVSPSLAGAGALPTSARAAVSPYASRPTAISDT